MGPNALPPISAEFPAPPEKVTVRLEAAGQLSKAGDVSATPAFRLDAPLARCVSILFDGTPVEAWRITQATAEQWQVDKMQGVSKGDIRFGAKFLLVDGQDTKPSFALRLMTKTTTGKDEALHRFTNAPGYFIDALTGWRPRPGYELDASLGFFAWQQGSRGQNDAVSWALSAKMPLGERFDLRAEAKGYVGWQTNDKPVQLGLATGYRLNDSLRLTAAANVGLRDAAAIEGRLGVEVALPSPLPLKI
jgi:hypothetical protein